MLLQGKKIFIVEDDPTNLAIISTILRRHGAKILFDAWGSEALDKIVKLQPIDVILLDLNLPMGNNGYDIFKKIRATPELATIPVALVTASNSTIEMNKARELGMNGFISKPISYTRFGNSIASIIAGEEVWLAEGYS